MTLPGCSECGAPAVAFDPGTEPQTSPIGGGITIDPGKSGDAWCFEHWPFRNEARFNQFINGGTYHGARRR